MSDVARAAVLIKQVYPDHSGYESARITNTWKRLRRLDRVDPEIPKKEKLRWKHSKVHDMWYEKVLRVDAWAMDAMRRAIELNECEKQDAAQQLEAARNEYQELRARYDRAKHSMANTDADFFGPTLDALALKIARFIAPEITKGDE